MSFQLLWQTSINGFALGWIYILMALGLSIIFGVTRIFQFAHGEIYMIGGYVTQILAVSLGWNVYVAILASMAVAGVIGAIMYFGLFRRFAGQVLNPILISVGLTLLLQGGAVVVFGITERHIPRLAKGRVGLLGAVLPMDRLVAVGVSVLLVTLLYVFLRKHRHGQAMIASAQSREGVVLQGISHDRMSATSMVAGSALAAAAGALAGSIFQLTPFMGTQPLTKGLIIIVLGGMGSIPGAVLGGIFLGLVDGVAPALLGPGWAAVLPLIAVVLVIVFRPRGLWGNVE
ncbi:MAG: branched-chain amino acid ABC transporter permease [Actinobacteria bacterium]|nr:branched-chain amino acid ABC transporter permease [Actinomycetota bacterium]